MHVARSFDQGRAWSTDLLFDRTPDGEPFGDRSNRGQEEREAVRKQHGNLHAHLARREDAGERTGASLLDHDELAYRNFPQRRFVRP